MAQHYSNPKRADDPHALPDIEVFYNDADGKDPIYLSLDPIEKAESGWYWWPCFPGCLPDGDPTGPFETEAAALADARDGLTDDDEGDD